VVNQVLKVRRQAGGRRTPLEVLINSPLRGRPHGSREPLRDFLVRWHEAFAELCKSEGIVEVFRITQGCVIEKEDGTRFQVRNFEKSGEGMKAASFKGIRRVYRSPLQIM
jgi:hypothetical protein